MGLGANNMLKPFVLVASLGLVAGGQPAGALAGEPDPPLDQLLKLNQTQLFGGEVEVLDVKQGRIRIHYPGKGYFTSGFQCTGAPGKGFISDQAVLKDESVKKMLLEGAEGTFSVMGLDRGLAVSRFELAGDLKISFKLKIPMLLPAGAFVLRFHQKDGKKSYIQTSFFQDIFVSDAGKKKRTAAQNKTYLQPPVKWFDKKSKGVPCEIVLAGKKLTISTKASGVEKLEEVVSQDGIEAPLSGKLSFEFSRLSFAMMDLVIEGKYDGSWLDSEIAKLKKAGKLKVKEPEVAKKEDKPPAGDAKGGSSKAGESKAAPRPVRKKKPKVNVDEPDPEGDDEL